MTFDMTPTPKISVIIPTFNRNNRLLLAIESALNQSEHDLEVIIADDNVEDAISAETKQIAQSFNGRVRYVKNNRTKGGCGARNTAILQAKGKYLAFLDDDDHWLPEKIKHQVNKIEGTEFIGTYSGFIDRNEAFGFERNIILEEAAYTRADALKGLCPTSASQVLVSRESVLNAGLFDEELTSFQDLDLWIRCLNEGPFLQTCSPLVKFVTHNGDRTSVNLEKRISGLNLFLKKWENEMGGHATSFFKNAIGTAHLENCKSNLKSNWLQSILHSYKALRYLGPNVSTLSWILLSALGPALGTYAFQKLMIIRGSNYI